MFGLVVILSFAAWIGGSDACTSGLGLAQLQTGQLVGQISNVSRDVQPTNVNAVNYAASVDPATQVVTPSQLSCTSFDNSCLWRTSNLSTVPWFQSTYKFDSAVLNYATGTNINPDGDFAIAVSQAVNVTDYAVLESPSFCQVGNGYLQVMVWASNGVRVQACVKSNAAASFDYCTLFMTENQPGPFSVSIPTPSQTPLKIYLIATNFNYSDSQYSGGFAALDQLTYMGTPCGQSTSSPPAAPPINLLASQNGPSASPPSMRPSSMPPSAVFQGSLPPSPPPMNSPPPSSLPTVAQAPLTFAPTTISLTTILTTTGQTPTTVTTTTSKLDVERNTTDSPPDVSVTQPPNDEESTPGKMYTSTFQFGSSDSNETNQSGSEEDGSGLIIDGSGSGSGSGIAVDVENSGSGGESGESDDREMVMAKEGDESGSGSGVEESNDVNSEKETNSTSAFVFRLPDDVTAPSGQNNTETTTTKKVPITPIIPIVKPTTLSTKTVDPMANMNMHYVVANHSLIQQTNANKNLPERIRNLMVNNESEEHSTTQSSNQQTLIDQLFNGRKSETNLSEENNVPKEELPQMFLPPNVHRPNPYQKPEKFIPTTTYQPPWYEFTTLYTNQRRPNSLDVDNPPYRPYQSQNLYPKSSQPNNNFYLNPPQWIQSSANSQL